jgi:hypothetical protein
MEVTIDDTRVAWVDLLGGVRRVLAIVANMVLP